jgi:hypothetical protein
VRILCSCLHLEVLRLLQEYKIRTKICQLSPRTLEQKDATYQKRYHSNRLFKTNLTFIFVFLEVQHCSRCRLLCPWMLVFCIVFYTLHYLSLDFVPFLDFVANCLDSGPLMEEARANGYGL